jgi:hypothetical protein
MHTNPVPGALYTTTSDAPRGGRRGAPGRCTARQVQIVACHRIAARLHRRPASCRGQKAGYLYTWSPKGPPTTPSVPCHLVVVAPSRARSVPRGHHMLASIIPCSTGSGTGSSTRGNRSCCSSAEPTKRAEPNEKSINKRWEKQHGD